MELQAQRLEVFSQRLQFADAVGHVADVLVQQGIDLATVLCRRFVEAEQGAVSSLKRDTCDDVVREF